jgi:ribonuclease HII
MLLQFHNKLLLEAGVDEAGRGCLAGPVFAAAVILPQNFKNKYLNDSKKLNEKTRYELRTIIENEAVAFAVAPVDNKIIDKINILQASFKAMNMAISKLAIKPNFLLIDGNRFKNEQNIPHLCIVKGDGKYASIAAASILAKTYRDDYMMAMHQKFPMYNWAQNKGYPTLAHRKVILEHGFSKIHRITFAVQIKEPQLLLFEKNNF